MLKASFAMAVVKMADFESIGSRRNIKSYIFGLVKNVGFYIALGRITTYLLYLKIDLYIAVYCN